MSRLPYPTDLSAIAPGAGPLTRKLPPLNIFRMLCHAPHIVQPFLSFGTALMMQGKLDPVTRECVILRVGYRSGAAYETAQHEAIGRAVGMTEALFDALKTGPAAPGFSSEQRLAVAFTDHLMDNPRPSDAALEPVRTHFGDGGVEELVFLIGYYMMVCRFLETFGVDIEAGGAAGATLVS